MRNNYIRMGSANKKKIRLNRSQLAVPGTRTEFFQKAAQISSTDENFPS